MMDMLRFRQNLFEQQHNSNNNSMKMEIDNFLDQNNNLNLDSAWPSALDSIMNNNRDSVVEKPDPDNIKMFVGQVPKDLDENDLRTIFEEFGRVHQINVLRDKYTGSSKGCCFVTFYTRQAALAAQNALHNIKTFHGGRVMNYIEQ